MILGREAAVRSADVALNHPTVGDLSN